jgi:hypothetical protein
MTAIPEECVPGNGKSPPWLRNLSHAASEYTSKQWYIDWLSTTTNLCTDLSRLAADNPGRSPIVWRTDRDPLFWYLDLPYTEREIIKAREDVFESGLVPLLSAGSLEFPGASSKSVFILAWYQPDLAFNHYTDGEPTPDNGIVFVIDAPGGIDRDSVAEGNPGHHGVLFPGGVRREFIKGAFTTVSTSTGSATTFEANPHYLAKPIPDGYFDLVVTPWSPSNAGVFPDSQIHVEPAGEPVGHIARRYSKGVDVRITLEDGANECWNINGRSRPGKGGAVTLAVADQLLPTLVVYRDKCPAGSS